jgi:Protein of unknown function (DUF2846)
MVFVIFLIVTALPMLQAGPAAAAEIPEVKEGQALIVFYREQRMAGAAIQFRVNQNAVPIGSLTNGSVMFRDVDPGQYGFSSEVVTGDSLSLTVEAGKIYFVQGTVRMGYFAGRPKFTVVDEATARKAVANIK